MPEDDREKLRQECQDDLDTLRADGYVSERSFRLFEKILARLTRLETEPERKSSSATWRNDGVLRALEEGKKRDDG